MSALLVAGVLAVGQPQPGPQAGSAPAPVAKQPALRTVSAVAGTPSECDMVDSGAEQGRVICRFTTSQNAGNSEHSFYLSPGATNLRYTVAGAGGGGGGGGSSSAAGGNAGSGAVFNGDPGAVAGHTIYVGVGKAGHYRGDNGDNPSTRYGTFNGGGGGDGTTSGGAGGKGGAASVLGYDGGLLAVAGGGGGGSGGVAGNQGFTGGNGGSGGGRTNNTSGGGGGDGGSSSGSGGGGGGGGYWAGNGGGGGGVFSRGDAGQGGGNYVTNGADYDRPTSQNPAQYNANDGFVYFAWYRSNPVFSVSTPSGVTPFQSAAARVSWSLPSGASGTVTVLDQSAGGVAVCSNVTASDRGCQLPADRLSGGNHSLRFEYSGDSGYAPYFTNQNLYIEPSTTTTTLDVLHNTDGTTTLTAATKPDSSTGIVDGTLSLTPRTTNADVSRECKPQTSPAGSPSTRGQGLSLTCTVSQAPGSVGLAATFSPAARTTGQNSGSSSTTSTSTVDKYTPTVDLQLSPNSLDHFGATSTATVKVTAPAGSVVDATGGTVTVRTADDHGSCTAGGPSATANHVTTFSCAITPDAGEQHFTAYYSGDGSYKSASSDAEQIDTVATTPTLGATTNSSSVQVGDTVTVTTTANANGTALRTGTLTVYDGPPAVDDSNAVGTVDLAVHPGGGSVDDVPSAGTHKYYVRFANASGSQNYTPVTVETAPVTVQPIESHLTVTVAGDAAAAKAGGIPTTVTALLSMSSRDTLIAPLTVTPAGATACRRSERIADGTRYITVVCSYLSAPGTSPTYTASYQDDLVGAVQSTGTALIPASPVTVAASATDVVYGARTSLSATIAPTVDGAAVSGKVDFTEGSTTLCEASVSTRDGVASASCTSLPLSDAGSHRVTATFAPDDVGAKTAAGATSPATAFTVSKAPVSITLSPAARKVGGADKLLATAAATVDGGGEVPTGSITFGDKLASCGTVPLVAGSVDCQIALPDAGTKSKLSATYVPGPNFKAGTTPSVTRSFQRAVAGECHGGFAKLWAAALKAKGGFSIDADPLGTVSLTTPSDLGDCDSSAVLGATADVSLFGGTLTASGIGVTVTSDTVCLDSGSLSLPAIWKSGALRVTEAICFPLTASGTRGGIGKPTSGALTLAASGQQGPPLIAVPGVTAGASLTARFGTSCPGKSVGEAGDCDAPAAAVTVTGVVPARDSTPGVTVAATVRPGGSIRADVTSTPFSVLGTSLTLAGTVTRDGTGALDANVSATTAAAASPATGLSLDAGATVTLSGGIGSSPKLQVAGTVRIGSGDTQLPLSISGSFTSFTSYGLMLASADPVPTWTPLPGLTLTPNLSGTLTRSGTTTTFAVTANGSNGNPLATWKAPAGATVTVDSISVGGDPTKTDLRCPYTNGGSVLALSGKVSVADLTVAASGCVSLADKGWHVAATATTASLGRLALSDVVLDVSKKAGGTAALTGSATAGLSVGSYQGSTTVTMRSVDGVFVVGGQIDATSLGLPSKYTYLAYASGAVEGWQTGLGDQGLGDDGEVDLPAGISLFGAWTIPAKVATLLRQAHFSLSPDSVVTFEAVVPKTGGGSLSFHAELATPSGMPLLTLPGGAAVQSASLDYANGTFGLTADGTIKGQDGVAAPVHLAVSIAKDGSLSGSASVTGLHLLGRSVDLSGSLSRTGAGVLSVSLTGAITGSIVLGDATLRDVRVSIGTGGLTAAGSMDVANTTVAFTASFASTTAYSLDVTATVRNWTPARGVTVNATIAGSLSRSAQGYSYDFAATPLSSGSGLITLTPASGVSLSLDSFELSNRKAPTGCSLGATGDTWLAVSGSLSLDVGAAKGTGSGTGCFDLTRPAFSLTIAVPGADFGGQDGKVGISGLAVTVSRDATGGFAARATARLKVEMPSGGQFSLVATLTFSEDGFAVGGVADLSSYLGGSAARAYLFFSNATLTVDTGDDTIGKLKLTPGVTVGLGFTVSDDVAKALKQVGLGVGAGTKLAATVHLDLDNATIKLKVAVGFKQTNLFSLRNGTYLRLDDTSLVMTLSPTQPSFGFETAATLHVPASVPGGSASDVGLKGGIRIGTELSAYLSVSNWNDALGLTGFNLRKFTLQGGITLTGLPLPSLAVAATVDGLPTTLANVIGYRQGAPISIALAIGETNLLFDVKIGTKGSTTPALQPFAFAGKADLLSVNFAELYLSPTGATIGDEVYPAGFSLEFDGRIAGVDVSVLAKVDPVKASLYFRGSVGTITAGSLVVGPTVLTIDVSPSKFDVTFSGRIAIGPSSTQIGPALRFSGYLKADVTLGVGTSGISAKLNFEASVSAGAYVAHDWCKQDGIWVLCDYYWDDSPPLTIRATNLGFALNSSGLTVDIPNTSHSITFPWPKSATSARARSLTSGARTGQMIDDRLISSPRPAASPPSTQSTASTWQQTGSLGRGRVLPASVTLRDGRVLVIGGTQNGTALRSAEIYDPRSGGWHAAADPGTARSDPAAVRLADGRVLVVGGDTGSGETATAELYDPATDRWTPAGSAPQRSQAASIALLADGTVLVAGGHVAGKPVAKAARFDPHSERWSSLPAMPGARAAASTATLPGGDVLIAGGMGDGAALRTAVLFDNDSGTWRTTGSMHRARFYATTSTLSDGRVLVAGAAPEAETYDPHTGQWTLAGISNAPTQLASAATLADGDVLVAGGLSAKGSLTQVDRYDVAANRWYVQRTLPQARAGAVAAVLPGGRVLVAGGLAQHQARSDAFVYTAGGGTVPARGYDPSALFTHKTGWPVWAWLLLVGGIVAFAAGLILLLRRRRVA